jgi:probable rRNA maturation factor
MTENFTLLNKTKGKLTGLPFSDIQQAVLGADYELSLVFVSEKEIQKLNNRYRQKDEPTNILSFPLTPTSGEIIICPTYTKGFSIGHLFIHGLMHLKGYDHGSTMEHEEEKIRARFNI